MKEFDEEIDKLSHNLKYTLAEFIRADEQYQNEKKKLYQKILLIQQEIVNLIDLKGEKGGK